MLVKWMNR